MNLALRPTLLLVVLAAVFSSTGVGCADAPEPPESSASSDLTERSVAGQNIARGLLRDPRGGDPAKPAPRATNPYEIVVDALLDEAEKRDPGVFERTMDGISEGDDGAANALETLGLSLRQTLASKALDARLAADPRLARARALKSGLATKSTGKGEADKSGFDLTDADKKVGLDDKGRAGRDQSALADLKDLAPPTAANLARRTLDLAAVKSGAVTPDPSSRLGAFEATKSFPPGTLGYGINKSIGTLYQGLGNYGQENVGRVFNDPGVQELLGRPTTDVAASQKLAAVEYNYWNTVREQNPQSAGGRIGTLFSQESRDIIQRKIAPGLGPYVPVP